jgi:ATP-binding cassette subfamily B protein
MLGEVLMRLLEPWPVRVVVDAVVPAAVEVAGVPSGVGRTIVLCAVATLAIVGMRALAAYLSTVAFALVGSRVTTRLRAQVYDHVLALSMRFHDRARPGDLVVRLTGDVQRLQEVAVSAALPLLGNVALFAGMAVVMIVIDPLLAGAVLVMAPLTVVFGVTSGRKITSASRRQRANEGAVAASASEALGAIKVVHSYGLEPLLGARFGEDNDRSLRSGVAARRLAAGLERRTDVVVGIGTAVVLLVGGRGVLSGRLTPGELVVFLSYLKTAFRPMRDVAKHTGRIARAAASGERIADLLDTRPEIVDRSYAKPLRAVRGDVELSGVTFGYDPGHPVLRGVDLHIRPGERVALVGESGAGKSTIVNLVLRLVEPSAGTVRIDGHDVRDVTIASLRASTAVVLQDSVLFAMSIAENIRCGRPDATDSEVVAAAQAANADGFIRRLADGYDSVVGERGATLSGGERQRVAIARAILRRAPIVVLDEPTTGLDAQSAGEVLDALEHLTEGRTTIVIAHDPMLTRRCPRIVEVGAGLVTERPRPPARRQPLAVIEGR